MEVLDQLLGFLRQGIDWIFSFILLVWNWVIDQIASVPWSDLGSLIWWKQIMLLLVGGGVGFFLYRAGMEILVAGQQALTALATLLATFVKTLIPIMLAGLVAAAGAWAINSVQL